MRLPMNYRYAEVMVHLVKTFKPEESFTAHDIKKDYDLPRGALQHLKGLSLLKKVDRLLVRTGQGKSRGGTRMVNVYTIPVGVHDYITRRSYEEDGN